MAAIAFTRQEMQRAWRESYGIYEQFSEKPSLLGCGNTHRLVLFYAVECGLKTVLLDRQRVDRTDQCAIITEAQHDINRLLDELRAGQDLKLPSQCWLKPLRDEPDKRPVLPGQLNQMWRYGGCAYGSPNDTTLEQHLAKIAEWIGEQL